MTMYTESLRAFLKPVLPFLDDESVTEILINAPDDVWIERKGRLIKTEARFSGEDALVGAARNMAQFVGRLITEERPQLDARLPDGSRIHVVLPPVARKGTTISIRKFFKDRLTFDKLIEIGTMTSEMFNVLEAIVQLKLNLVVAGGTGSGKTTLLNVVSSLIQNHERILTIEDSAELQLTQDHLVSFESRPADKYGKNAVDMGSLLQSALRLRPDRIIVGEVRGGECFYLMQAMNTGHGGSLATTHANTPTDTLRRLESLCLMNAIDMPLVAVRAQVASAIHCVITTDRLQDGSRKITHIAEVLPLNERGEYRTQDIWVYTPLGKDPEGNILGYFAPTGILPSFLPKARAYGFENMTPEFFDPAHYGLPPPPLYALGEDYALKWAPSLKHREKQQPDPDSYQEAIHQLERRLKEQSRARAANGDQVPAAAKPKPVAAPTPVAAARPVVAPKPPAPAFEEEKTPPPTKRPLAPIAAAREETPAPTPTGNTPRPQPKRVDEPKIEIADDLLSEASELVAKETTQRRSVPTAPPGRHQLQRPVAAARPTRDEGSEPSDPNKTQIKPAPRR